jgi:hypothetical protein
VREKTTSLHSGEPRTYCFYSNLIQQNLGRELLGLEIEIFHHLLHVCSCSRCNCSASLRDDGVGSAPLQLADTEKNLLVIKQRVDAGKLSGADAIGLRVGKIVNQ